MCSIKFEFSLKLFFNSLQTDLCEFEKKKKTLVPLKRSQDAFKLNNNSSELYAIKVFLNGQKLFICIQIHVYNTYSYVIHTIVGILILNLCEFRILQITNNKHGYLITSFLRWKK